MKIDHSQFLQIGNVQCSHVPECAQKVSTPLSPNFARTGIAPIPSESSTITKIFFLFFHISFPPHSWYHLVFDQLFICPFNPASACANALFTGSFGFFLLLPHIFLNITFIHSCPFFGFFVLESRSFFSLYPQPQIKVSSLPLSSISIRLWHFGQRAFVVLDTVSSVIHILCPGIPASLHSFAHCPRRFSTVGQSCFVRLSCRKVPCPVFISLTISQV